MYPIIIQYLEDAGKIPKPRYNVPSNNNNNDVVSVTKYQGQFIFFDIFRTMMEKSKKFFSF
jgi:hypothetical protein